MHAKRKAPTPSAPTTALTPASTTTAPTTSSPNAATTPTTSAPSPKRLCVSQPHVEGVVCSSGGGIVISIGPATKTVIFDGKRCTVELATHAELVLVASPSDEVKQRNLAVQAAIAKHHTRLQKLTDAVVTSTRNIVDHPSDVHFERALKLTAELAALRSQSKVHVEWETTHGHYRYALSANKFTRIADKLFTWCPSAVVMPPTSVVTVCTQDIRLPPLVVVYQVRFDIKTVVFDWLKGTWNSCDDPTAFKQTKALASVRCERHWSNVLLSWPKALDACGGIEAVWFRDRLHLIGGHKRGGVSLQTFFALDGKVWTRLPDLPRAIHATSAAVLDNKLYVFGGCRKANVTKEDWDQESDDDDDFAVSDVMSFDGKTWSTAHKHMDDDRHGHSVVVFNEAVYLVGGICDERLATHAERYNALQGSWDELRNTPEFPEGSRAVVAAGTIYVICADTGKVHRMKPDGTWELVPSMTLPVKPDRILAAGVEEES